jgi:hypothetical protein
VPDLPIKSNDSHLEIVRHDLIKLAHNPSESPEQVVARAKAYFDFVTDAKPEEWSYKDER